MIPADVASRLRLVTPDLPAPPQPVQNAQKLTDILSDFGVGQRIMAEIQALLPNGTYRAVVGQRDVTLSLPFSAKPGDSLELEVKENDGHLSLALVKHTPANAPPPLTEERSVATKLSSAGQLIGDLLGEIDQQGGKARPAPLNANQPLFSGPPPSSNELAPMLRQALAESGMFYESHQARWVEGKLPTAELLKEPQGKLSNPVSVPSSPPARGESAPPSSGQQPSLPSPAFAPGESQFLPFAPAAAPGEPSLPAPGNMPQASPGSVPMATPDATPAEKNADGQATNLPTPVFHKEENHAAAIRSESSQAGVAAPAVTPENQPRGSTIPTGTAMQPGPAVAPELTNLVQQQLGALASQTYVWQGQAWPGQNMHWEIAEDEGRRNGAGGIQDQPQWQTRLRLTLPLLGEIDAHLRLAEGGKVDLSLTTRQAESRQSLLDSAAELQQHMQASGLTLKGFSIALADLPPQADSPPKP